MSGSSGLGRPEEPEEGPESLPLDKDRPVRPLFVRHKRELMPSWNEWEWHLYPFSDPQTLTGWRRRVRAIGVWAIIGSIAVVVLALIVTAL